MEIDEFNAFDIEIKNHLILKALSIGDKLKLPSGEEGVFTSLSTIYYGRLGAPGIIPGKYYDNQYVILDIGNESRKINISELILTESILSKIQTFDFDSAHIIKHQFIEDLPNTDIWEGDIVRLIDPSHENYSDIDDENQYTVNRINYDFSPIQYKLRRGAKVFTVDGLQIEKCSDGPVRLFSDGEGYKLKWTSTKAEAEFFVLLGRYSKVYNHNSKSYYWPLLDAQQILFFGGAHAILSLNDKYVVIKFWDSEIADKTAELLETILDI